MRSVSMAKYLVRMANYQRKFAVLIKLVRLAKYLAAGLICTANYVVSV